MNFITYKTYTDKFNLSELYFGLYVYLSVLPMFGMFVSFVSFYTSKTLCLFCHFILSLFLQSDPKPRVKNA